MDRIFQAPIPYRNNVIIRGVRFRICYFAPIPYRNNVIGVRRYKLKDNLIAPIPYRNNVIIVYTVLSV